MKENETVTRITVCRDSLTQSNCYLIGEKGGAMVIDPNHFELVENALREQALTPELVMLSHEHCDHIRGLEELRNHWRVKVLCSRRCSQGIGDITQNMSRMMEVYLLYRTQQSVVYPPFICRPAELVYDAPYDFTWHGHRFLCTPLPGHSGGSSCIFMDDTCLFTGDYLIPGEQVVTRLPGGSEQEYEETAKPWLSALKAGLTIYPGHNDSYVLTREVKERYGL